MISAVAPEPHNAAADTQGWSAGVLPAAEQVASAAGAAAMLSYLAQFSFAVSLPLAVERDGQRLYNCAYEWRVAVEAMSCLTLAGQWLADVEAVGPLLVGLYLGGWDRAVSWSASHARDNVHVGGMSTAPYNAHEATLASAEELIMAPEDVARRLLDPWLAAFYEGGLDLFAWCLA